MRPSKLHSSSKSRYRDQVPKVWQTWNFSVDRDGFEVQHGELALKHTFKVREQCSVRAQWQCEFNLTNACRRPLRAAPEANRWADSGGIRKWTESRKPLEAR